MTVPLVWVTISVQRSRTWHQLSFSLTSFHFECCSSVRFHTHTGSWEVLRECQLPLVWCFLAKFWGIGTKMEILLFLVIHVIMEYYIAQIINKCTTKYCIYNIQRSLFHYSTIMAYVIIDYPRKTINDKAIDKFINIEIKWGPININVLLSK